ncbi:hypothetical protein VCHA53O466_320010 [Vibrio chagasii]|nr:hypothetical protein VCHA53O466_320010 [Vibrio chagasii]
MSKFTTITVEGTVIKSQKRTKTDEAFKHHVTYSFIDIQPLNPEAKVIRIKNAVVSPDQTKLFDKPDTYIKALFAKMGKLCTTAVIVRDKSYRAYGNLSHDYSGLINSFNTDAMRALKFTWGGCYAFSILTQDPALQTFWMLMATGTLCSIPVIEAFFKKRKIKKFVSTFPDVIKQAGMRAKQ